MDLIKELALESGLPSAGFTKTGPALVNEREIYRFAQLIVHRCAEIADLAEPYQASDLIKKMFSISSSN
jgi:hypothetical protein